MFSDIYLLDMEPCTSFQSDKRLAANSGPVGVDRMCLICTDVSDGLHFGIYACRACTAFFRRTIVMGKTYLCRKGGDKCRVHKSQGRAMCRKCRFRLCMEHGMQEEMVQLKKDAQRPSASLSGSVTASSDEGSPQAVEVVTLSDTDEPEYLYEIFRSYRKYCKEEAEAEMLLKATASPGEVQEGPYPGLHRVRCRLHFKMCRGQVEKLNSFVWTIFKSEIPELTPHEQSIMFAHSMGVMWVLDGAYRTQKRLPPNEFCKKSVRLQTTYLDKDYIEDFASDLLATTKFGRENLYNVICANFSRERNKVLFELHELKVKNEEYAALLVLCIWNSNMENCTPNLERMAKLLRKKVFQELHVWYSSVGKEEYSQRMCEVLHIIQTVLDAEALNRVDMELYNFHDMFQNEKVLYDTYMMKSLSDALPSY